MNRRQLLKLLLSGAVSQSLDLDLERLLWTPTKTIFLPTLIRPTLSQIIALELERITPKIQTLFERDDVFYRALSKKVNIDRRLE